MKIALPPESPEPKRDSLPAWLRILIDGIFLLICLAALPLSLTFRSWNSFDLKDGLVLLCILLALTIPATAISILILRLSAVSRKVIPIQATRLSARGGVLIATVGGGIFVLIAVLRSREILPETALSAPPYSVWMVTMLSFIPVVSFASLLGLLLSLLLRPRNDKATVVVRRSEDETAPAPKWPGILYALALSAACLCLISPVVLFWWPAPEPAPIASPSRPLPASQKTDSKIPEKTTPQNSKAATFSFHEPLGFDTAAALEWTVLTQKEIPNVNDRRPVMMSPSGRFLAFASRNHSGTLVLFDLNQFEIHSTYPDLGSLRALAWSPSSDSVFVLSAREQPVASVIRVNDQKLLTLPLSPGTRLPDSQPFWWDEFEVAFFPDNSPSLYLDLAELRVRPIAESHRWRRLQELSASGDISPPQLELPESSHARFTAAPRITAYRAPGYQHNDWSLSSESVLAIEDKNSPLVVSAPSCPILPGDRIAATGRSMKIVRISEGRALVTYFTLRDPAPSQVEVSLPEGTNLQSKEEFRKQTREHQVCAFVCAPRINPITEQVIGPDRERVKALVRWMSDSKGTIRFWIAEHFADVEQGDILSDLHLWEDGDIVSCDSPLKERWWAPVSPVPPEPDAPPPSLPELDRVSRAEFRSADGTLHLARLTYPVLKPRPQTETPGPAPTSVSVTPPTTPKTTEPPPPPKSPEDRIRAFVWEHYRNLEQKEINAYLDDYTDYIVLHGKAGTKGDILRQTLLALRSARAIEADVAQAILVRKEPSVEAERYGATFEVTLTLTAPSGKKTIQRSLVTLGVFLVGEDIRIVEENGKLFSDTTR